MMMRYHLNKETLANGWLKANGKFENVSRREQQTWAARHLINVLKDLTPYGNEVEEKLQEIYNYMKFEDGVLMTAIWRKPNMTFTLKQIAWVKENWASLTERTQEFISNNMCCTTNE